MNCFELFQQKMNEHFAVKQTLCYYKKVVRHLDLSFVFSKVSLFYNSVAFLPSRERKTEQTRQHEYRKQEKVSQVKNDEWHKNKEIRRDIRERCK